MGIELLAYSGSGSIELVMIIINFLLIIGVPAVIIILLIKGGRERRAIKREVEQLREDIKKISGS